MKQKQKILEFFIRMLFKNQLKKNCKENILNLYLFVLKKGKSFLYFKKI